jgi:hypothetical protein
MKQAFLISIIIGCTLVTSCKKQYSCECNTMGYKTIVFNEKTTEEKASKKCKGYENSETDCTIK